MVRRDGNTLPQAKRPRSAPIRASPIVSHPGRDHKDPIDDVQITTYRSTVKNMRISSGGTNTPLQSQRQLQAICASTMKRSRYLLMM